MSFYPTKEHQRKHAQALYNLRDVEPVRELLEQKVESLYKSLVKADELVNVYRIQGRISAYEDLLKAIDESPDTLARLDSRK